MHKEGWKGSVTVFFSLTCMLFLAVICTVVESARVQGAKAQTANILGMGNVSLLGEFERELLERYEIFALDGSYGSGKFQTKKIQEQLEQYIFLNTNPGMEGLSGLCFDPWNLNLTETAIESYALLTDSKGEPFYQQAVSFMKENMGVLAVEELLEYQETVSEINEYEKNYEISQRHNDGTMANLEGQKQGKIESLESEAEAQSIQGEVTVDLPAQEQVNPLEEIAKLRKKSTLELVTWGNRISQKKLTVRTLPSKSSLRKGTLKLKKEHRCFFLCFGFRIRNKQEHSFFQFLCTEFRIGRNQFLLGDTVFLADAEDGFFPLYLVHFFPGLFLFIRSRLFRR